MELWVGSNTMIFSPCILLLLIRHMYVIFFGVVYIHC